MRKNFTKILCMFAFLCAAFNITQGANTSNILDTTPPANLRIGFGSSSETGIDIHLLRALKLAIPYAAVAHDDVFSVCKNNSATFNPLFNDTVYTGLITAPAPATANTAGVGATFQFVDAAGLVLGTSSYTETGVGTWTFIPSTRIVTFTPVLDFTGTATIKYNIKGTTAPYNTEAYRSDPGTITAIIKTNCDADNDKIIDDADLDDDNDGILDTVEGQCTTPTRTTTWKHTPNIPYTGLATATGATAFGNVVFTSAPMVPAEGETSTTFFVTDNFNMPIVPPGINFNFWYTTSPSDLRNKPSLKLTQTWDATPPSLANQLEPASVDGGKRMVTITFPTPVNKVLLNLDRLGGTANVNSGEPYYSNSIEFTMTTPNMGMSKLAGNLQFIVTPTKFYRDPDVNFGTANPGNEANNTTGTAAGTVEIKKNDGSSFTSITFTTIGVGPDGIGSDGIEMIFEFCKDRDTDLDGLPDYLDLDSDGDGCADATEGGAGFALANLVNSSMPGGNSGAGYTGTSTSPIIQNLCATAYTGTATDCVGSTGIPLVVNQTTGQSAGTSTDGAVKATVCSLCYKPGVLDASSTFPTKHGITALGRAGAENENWPMTRESAWTVLESKEKGFVVNRVTSTANLANITNPVEGMMVYDEEADCLKIFTLKSGDSVMGWHCFITPACPD